MFAPVFLSCDSDALVGGLKLVVCCVYKLV